MVAGKIVNTSFGKPIEESGEMCYILVTDLKSQYNKQYLRGRGLAGSTARYRSSP